MFKLLLALLLITLPTLAITEKEANDWLAKELGGTTETSYEYEHGRIYVDVETKIFVIEGGLDKRSSLDSVQQAMFFHILTGKEPCVVIYDTDGKKGAYENRIEQVCERLRIKYWNMPISEGDL